MGNILNSLSHTVRYFYNTGELRNYGWFRAPACAGLRETAHGMKKFYTAAIACAGTCAPEHAGLCCFSWCLCWYHVWKIHTSRGSTSAMIHRSLPGIVSPVKIDSIVQFCGSCNVIISKIFRNQSFESFQFHESNIYTVSLYIIKWLSTGRQRRFHSFHRMCTPGHVHVVLWKQHVRLIEAPQ